MNLKPKEKNIQFSSFRGPTGLRARVEAITNQSGANYTDTMLYLLEMGIGAHLMDNVEKSKAGEVAKVEAKKAPVKRFVKPTLKEVMDLFADKGFTVYEGEKFFDYYESNGWKVGKNSMKDWRAAVRNWTKNSAKTSNSMSQPQRGSMPDRTEEFKSLGLLPDSPINDNFIDGDSYEQE